MRKNYLNSRHILFALMCLFAFTGRAAVGNTFKANTTEGKELWFMITNESPKTCQVGTNSNSVPAITDKPWDYAGTLTIPEVVNNGTDNYTVTRIGNYAFEWSNVSAINIPLTVTEFGVNAFNSCYKLATINFPAGLTSIGQLAFLDCKSLTSITIPASVTTIGTQAFMGCNLASMTSITIPASVTSIGSEAFNGCNLASVSVEGSNPIYDSRNNCNAIIETTTNKLIFGCKNTVIPSNVTSIGNYAFSRCTELTSIEIPASVTSIENYAFYKCGDLTSVSIPEGVTSLGYDAFSSCELLTSVVIPSTLTSMGVACFQYCSGLTQVTMKSTSAIQYPQQGFNGVASTCQLYLPKGTKSDYIAKGWTEEVFKGGVYDATTVKAKDCSREYGEANPTLEYDVVGVPLIGVPSLSCSATALSAVGTYDIVPSEGTIDLSMEDVTFVNGTLTVEKAPLTVTAKSYEINEADELPTYAADFSGFKNGETNSVLSTQPSITCDATRASRPGNYDIVASGAVAGNYDINYVNGTLTINKTLNVGSTFTDVVDGVVMNFCVLDDEERTVEIYTTNPAFSSNYPAINKTTAGTVTIPSKVRFGAWNVVSIGRDAFNNCQNVTSFVFESPSQITKIGISAFYRCTGISSISIPSSVTQLNMDAFKNCSSLSNITIPSSVTSIDQEALHGTAWLNNMADGPVYINNILYNYKGTIPENSTITVNNGTVEIAANAFIDQTGLFKVELPSTLTKIDCGAFSGCSNLNVVVSNATSPSTLNYQKEKDAAFSSVYKTSFDGISSNCILMVPSGTTSDYSSAGWTTSIFKGGIYEANSDIALTDGLAYTFPVDLATNQITYTRTFSNTNWQALYVPFGMSYSDWSSDFEVAEITEISGEGASTVVVVEEVTTSTDPNKPYLIKAKTSGSKTITLNSATLKAAEETSFNKASGDYNFIFTGTYKGVSGSDMVANKYYALGGGTLHQAESESNNLSSFRWYLSIRDGSNNPVTLAPSSVKMVMRGNGGTLIDLVPEDAENEAKNGTYDLSGRKVEANKLERGIYIINGKKILVK